MPSRGSVPTDVADLRGDAVGSYASSTIAGITVHISSWTNRECDWLEETRQAQFARTRNDQQAARKFSLMKKTENRGLGQW